eukprot:m.37719 g.37719  ORF g.37719 m.37719 type:complete len:182 (+) comp12538_c0_seq2:152-697(+)
MLGFGEFVLIAGLGVSVVGLKGLPRLARSAGYGLGTISKILRTGSVAVSNIAQQQNVAELQREMQAGLHEVNQIRSEWHSLTQMKTYTSAMTATRPTSDQPAQPSFGQSVSQDLSAQKPPQDYVQTQTQDYVQPPTQDPQGYALSTASSTRSPASGSDHVAAAMDARTRLRSMLKQAQEQQ